MSILDDAIREHLELKRAHGADEAELKRLEDEAFGPPQRPDEPDPYAEAPTEFLVAPGKEGAPEPSADGAEETGGRRVPNLTDLQEAPPLQAEPADELPAEATAADPPEADVPAEEEHPVAEHEVVADTGPSTEERHAIASQPTEMFDVEAQFEDAATEADAPSDEELAEAELSGEPRIVPAEPLPAEDEPADEFDEFFSEQRLSDELNQALEAPLPDEPAGSGTEEATAVYEVEVVEPDYPEVEEPEEEISEEHELPAGEHDEEYEDEEPPAAAADSRHADALEGTPEFLEDAPEDDNLWFEQKPPKDIDFGD
jgi:hypothetical protein